jgi:hypothetical protein
VYSAERLLRKYFFMAWLKAGFSGIDLIFKGTRSFHHFGQQIRGWFSEETR